MPSDARAKFWVASFVATASTAVAASILVIALSGDDAMFTAFGFPLVFLFVVAAWGFWLTAVDARRAARGEAAEADDERIGGLVFVAHVLLVLGFLGPLIVGLGLTALPRIEEPDTRQALRVALTVIVVLALAPIGTSIAARIGRRRPTEPEAEGPERPSAHQPRRIGPTTRRRLVTGALLTLACLIIGTAGTLALLRARYTPERTAVAFLEAWSRSDWTILGGLTAGDPNEAMRWHAGMFETLRVSEGRFSLVSIRGRRATFRARVRLRGLGTWTYRGRLSLAPKGVGWVVAWNPSTVHPALGPGRMLDRTRQWPERAAILAADERPLTVMGEVVSVGVEPRRIKNPQETLDALATHTGADPERVKREIAGAQPDWFVPVVDLREERYAALRSQLAPVPGVVFRRKTARILVAEGFAAHVVGRVGEVTAERLRELGEPYLPGDSTGTSGAERAFERDLAGAPSGTVVVKGGVTDPHRRVLHRFEGRSPTPVRLTIDPRIQEAAERALDGVEPAAVVAIDPASGEVRAAASRPLAAFNRALDGGYPPGSTFKVVTAYALLRKGVRPEEDVSCPGTVTIGGKAFRNAEGVRLGTVAFRDAFAHSCNTAFVQLADRLTRDELAGAAEAFGFGVTGSGGPLAMRAGRFPTPADDAEHAAAAIGQGRVLASPVHMASVAAAAASGTWRTPSIVSGSTAGGGTELDAAAVVTLRDLMRLVVRQGTGTTAAVPGPPVAGKTGTAEFGPGDARSTHAWFIGFRDGVAFAVLVEGGGTGGTVAAPIAARFLAGLDARP